MVYLHIISPTEWSPIADALLLSTRKRKVLTFTSLARVFDLLQQFSSEYITVSEYTHVCTHAHIHTYTKVHFYAHTNRVRGTHIPTWKWLYFEVLIRVNIYIYIGSHMGCHILNTFMIRVSRVILNKCSIKIFAYCIVTFSLLNTRVNIVNVCT